MATYLVTGGAGFIGSHLVAELLRRGERVRILDNFSTGRRENLPAGGACEVIDGDIADAAVAARAVAGCEFVLHQGAIPSVPRSIQEPLATNRANVDGIVNILVAARDAGVKRLVFAGSSSVYGNSVVLPKREDMRPAPLTPYALQKLVGEQYCQLFTQLYGLETVVTRYFNVFGPRQQPGSPYSGVISLFIEALANHTAPTVYGDGRQTRDFTYVGDVVNGVLQACTAPKASGEVINVAAGGRVSLLELIRALQHILGTSVEPIFKPSREGDVHDSQADIFKARQLLGFEPTTPFEEGLRRTVEWYQQSRVTAGSRP
ncbi:MAG TPA: SDR family oxidoreductase [Vicinamibacterales bacterium]|nr:SDR family oxidoreductase [Vicinamibacterales bacterium]